MHVEQTPRIGGERADRGRALTELAGWKPRVRHLPPVVRLGGGQVLSRGERTGRAGAASVLPLGLGGQPIAQGSPRLIVELRDELEHLDERDVLHWTLGSAVTEAAWCCAHYRSPFLLRHFVLRQQ